MLKLFVKDNTNGCVHEYGTDPHDALILMDDGSLHYEHLQCCVGTMFPEEGFSFCYEDGSIPADIAMPYIDIGGCTYDNADAPGLVLKVNGGTGYFPKEFIVGAIEAFIERITDEATGKPKTNADRIRAMTDEELVKYFWDIGVWDSFEDGKFCDNNCNAEHNCDLCRLKWLQQPAEGE